MESVLARLTTMRDELNALITEVSSQIRADPVAAVVPTEKKRPGRPKKTEEVAPADPAGGGAAEKALTDMTGQELRDIWAGLTGREKGLKSSGKFSTKALLIEEIQRLRSAPPAPAEDAESVASKHSAAESSTGKKSLADMSEEEKKAHYKARAMKAAATRAAKKADAEGEKVVAQVEAEAKELVAKHETETKPLSPPSAPAAAPDSASGDKPKKRAVRKSTPAEDVPAEEKRMCRVCVTNLNLGNDHRPCLVKAFDEGMFTSVAEWEADTIAFGKTFA